MAAIRSASMTVVRSTTRLLTTTAKFQHAQQSAPQALRRPVTLRLLHASACSAAKADSSHSRHGHRNPKKELLDFYKILGVGHNASHADIKTAFRELGLSRTDLATILVAALSMILLRSQRAPS